MNIKFPSSQIQSFQTKIAEYDSQNFNKSFIGADIIYRYVETGYEPYEVVRFMQNEGVEFIGFPAYILMTKTDYDTNDVPVGVSHSEILDENGDPTGIQKKWFEWQSSPIMIKNDNLEVIIPTTYANKASTVDDLEIFDNAIDVVKIFGTQELKSDYLNNPLWLKDENNNPITKPPIDKTASYYTLNWEKEAFDFIHAQRLVKTWFQGLPGTTTVDKFNSLAEIEKKEVIRWGILDDTAIDKSLIEATLPNPKSRTSYRGWHIRRAINARTKRFNIAWNYLIDNLTNNAITTKLDAMLTFEMREFYILRGRSNQSRHLIVNGKINPIFWAAFNSSDVAYSDNNINHIKTKIEQILDGDKFVETFTGI